MYIMGCCWLSLCFAICIISSVLSEVILSPPTNAFVPVCLGGSASIMCSTTEGALFWISGSGNRVFNNLQPDEPLGNLTLSVQSAVLTGNTLSVNSTATVNNFKASLNNTLVVCRESTTNNSKQATFVTAGPPPAPTVTSITQINSSSLLISWIMSDCALQYVVTIINSSDGSVYLNITTSDTNTTVTLPTSVEYCVTVLGVDSIGRRGPPSQQQCHINIPSMSSSIIICTSIGSTIPTSSPSPSTPSVDPPPSGVSGGLIAGVAIGVIVLVVIVSVIVAVLVIVLYHRRRGYGELPLSNKQEIPLDHVKCVCQMYYQEVGLNHWKVVFVFVLSDHLESVKMLYKSFREYGSPIDCYWKSSDTIQMKVINNKPDGWTVHTSDEKVHKATIEGYTGEGSSPRIEMMITADSNKTTPPDLTVEAKLKGVRTEPNIIKFEREAQNVVECVYQVFYYKLEGINHWRARFVFTPKQHKKKVEDLYQDTNNCSWWDIGFGGGVIEVSTDGTIVPAGWEVTINKQVTTVAVDQYTGEGEPPYCEMILRATDIDKSDDQLKLPVTLIGVREMNNIFRIRRALVDRHGIPRCALLPFLSPVAPATKYVYQVFYHKIELNYWNATIAFYSKHPTVTKRVQHLYQDANSDPPVDITSFSLIKPNITKVDGWTVFPSVKHKEVKYEKVIEYLRDGVGSPPHCGLVLKAASDDITPPDLVLDITLSGVSGPCSKLKIIRKAEKPDNGEKVLTDVDYLPERDVQMMPTESDDNDVANRVTSLKLKSETQPPVAPVPHTAHCAGGDGDTPKAGGDTPIAGGDADSTKAKAEDTEKKQQSQFPMESKEKFEVTKVTHSYDVNLPAARKNE